MEMQETVVAIEQNHPLTEGEHHLEFKTEKYTVQRLRDLLKTYLVAGNVEHLVRLLRQCSGANSFSPFALRLKVTHPREDTFIRSGGGIEDLAGIF
jgi:hypothetical protein